MQAIDIKDGLSAKAAKWKAALSDAATGPQRIAAEVVSLANDWERYREEAEGQDCTTWIRKTIPPYNLARFQRLMNSANKLGDYAKRALHHQAVIFVANGVPAPKLEQVKTALIRKYRESGNNPVTLCQAHRIVARELDKKAKPKVCKGCLRLEKILKQHGIAATE